MSNIPDNQKAIITSKIHEGMRYVNNQQYDKSLPYFNEAWETCKSFDKEGKDPLTAMAAIGIGTVKHGNGDCKEALEWYNKGLAIREDIYQEEARTETAHLYRTIGMCNYAIGKYRESLSNFYKQRDMFEELEKSGQIHNQDMIEVYNNIGVCYERLNNHERSLENYQIVMDKRKILYESKNYLTELPKKMDSSYYQAIDDYVDSLRNVGAAYYRLGTNYSKSESFFHNALELKQSIYGEEPHQDTINLYKDLALTYEMLQDAKSSLDYTIKHLEMKFKFTKIIPQEDLLSKTKTLDDLASACDKLVQRNQKNLVNHEQALFVCKEIIQEYQDLIKSHSTLKELHDSFNHDNKNSNNIVQLQPLLDKINAGIVQDGANLMISEENQISYVGESNN